MSIELKQEAQRALEALEEIALAGMSGTGQESEEGMRDWHARQAWKFIGIAARALDPLRAAIQQASTAESGPVARAWAEGYRQGIEDERISEANIGIAGFGAKVNPNRENPYANSHPAPGVPDAIEPPVENGTEYDYCSGRSAGYAEGWNDCRDAMLAASPAQKGGE